MNIYLVIVLLFGFGYSSRYISKNLKQKETDPLRKRISMDAMKAVFDNIKDYLLFAGKSFLVIVALLWLTRLTNLGVDYESFIKIQGVVSILSEKLEPVSGFFGWVLMILSIAVVLYTVYKNAKFRLSQEMKLQAEDLIYKYNNDQLEPMEDSAEMKEVKLRIAEIYSVVEKINDNIYQVTEEDYNATMRIAHEKVNQLNTLLAHLDVERRINISNKLRERKDVRGKILRLLLSEGIYNSVSGVGGWVKKGIAFAGLMTIISVQLHYASAKISDDMAIDAMKNEIASIQLSLDKSEGLMNFKLKQEDEQYLDAMAADFELAVWDNPFWDEGEESEPEDKDNIKNAFMLHSLAVREKILEHFVNTIGERSEDRKFSAYESISSDKVNEPGGYRQALLKNFMADVEESADNVGKNRKPRTELGKRYRQTLKESITKKSKSKWEMMKANFADYKASFERPASLKNATGKIFSSITSDLPSNLERFGNNGLGKAANEIAGSVGEDNLKVIYDNLIYKHIEKVTSNTPYADAWNKIKNMESSEFFPGKKIAEHVKSNLPNLHSSEIRLFNEQMSPSLHVSSGTQSEKILQTISSASLSEADLSRITADFDTYFPGQNKEFAGTSVETAPKGKSALTRNSAIYGNKAKNIISKYGSLGSQVNLAHNIKGLRGFSRVGGVLIGDTPEGKAKIDITDFHWKTYLGGVILIFRNEKGQETNFGPYPLDILASALVYAADGRPTTVTMVDATPAPALKILLHPSLVNSQLGLEAIELDRWVDKYSVNDKMVNEARTFTEGINILYQMANTYRMMDNGKTADSVRQMFQQILKSPNLELLARRKLTPKNCPLFEKDIFYDPALVKILQDEMSKQTGSVKKLEANIYKAIKGRWEGWSSLENDSTEPDTVFIDGKWIPVRATRYTTWSGVREAAYSIGDGMVFVPQNKTTSNGMNYPFDFILQTAITEGHLFTDNIDDLNKEFIDEDPWQYPLLKQLDRINKNVFFGRSMDPQKQQMQTVFVRMAQFTEAQRLFRLAFKGDLGYKFPLVNFLALLKSFRVPVPYVQTPEWNIRY